jgi:hypothetical protein
VRVAHLNMNFLSRLRVSFSNVTCLYFTIRYLMTKADGPVQSHPVCLDTVTCVENQTWLIALGG